MNPNISKVYGWSRGYNYIEEMKTNLLLLHNFNTKYSILYLYKLVLKYTSFIIYENERNKKNINFTLNQR